MKFLFLSLCLFLFACKSTVEKKNGEEQIHLDGDTSNTGLVTDSLSNSIGLSGKLSSYNTFPSDVILTGMPSHRLIPVYKMKPKEKEPNTRMSSFLDYSSKESDYAEENIEHFMPGLDILYGFNLLNISHYCSDDHSRNVLFNKAVLIKSIYFPSFVQDSLNGKPINRNYYLVSAYDEDTNKDSLLNKFDLRKLYHFDASGKTKTQLIPSNYSILRSLYDSATDKMYVYAALDENKNGTHEKREPVHIFSIDLKDPKPGIILY